MDSNAFRTIAAIVRDIILVFDLEGRIVRANDEACRTYGYTHNEMLKLKLADIRSPDTMHLQPTQIKTAIETGILFETLHVRKDGSVFPVEVSSRSAVIGGEKLLFSIIRDISERVQREADLNKLITAVEQSPVSIVITDIEGKIEYVNPKFTHVTGYTQAEALGENPRILKSGEQPPAVYAELWQTIAAGGEWRGEFHNRKKDGQLYWEFASISPIRDSTGRITSFIAIKEDITARKAAEAALARDLALARLVQENFLPKPFQSHRLSVDTIFEPYHHVSGDIFDFAWDEQKQILSGYIIDVMGHGIGTALQTAALRVLGRQAMEKNLSPRDKLDWINRQSMPFFAEDTLAAAIYFELDLERKVLTYSSAGINYFLTATGQYRGVVSIPGPFLGLAEDIELEEHAMSFDRGSSFYFMSDGLFELLEEEPAICLMNEVETSQMLRSLIQSDKRHDDATAIMIHIH